MQQQTSTHPHGAHNTVMSVIGLSGGPGEKPLFYDLALQLPAGVSALLGDEGVGKTSLMRLLSGDLPATAGQLRLTCEVAPLTLPRPSAVFWTDLRLPLHDNDTPPQCWAQLRESLANWSDETQNVLTEALQLSPHLNKKLNMLSTGTRRKVGLVASLASGATVTLLDQPFVALDQDSIRSLQSFLAQLDQCPGRAWLIADYDKPAHVPLASVHHL